MNLIMQSEQLSKAENRLRLKMEIMKPLSEDWILTWNAWGRVLQVSEWLRTGNRPTPEQKNDINEICNWGFDNESSN